MDSLQIKDRIHKYIDNADERMLKIFNAIIEAEENEGLHSHEEIVEERLNFHQENPKEGKSWEEVQDALKEKYGL